MAELLKRGNLYLGMGADGEHNDDGDVMRQDSKIAWRCVLSLGTKEP